VSADGRHEIRLDQTRKPVESPFHWIGTYSFNGMAVVEIRNDAEAGDEGYVVVDAVQFLPAIPPKK
jgi:hypothetical protein